jgi:hypothetical protein
MPVDHCDGSGLGGPRGLMAFSSFSTTTLPASPMAPKSPHKKQQQLSCPIERIGGQQHSNTADLLKRELASADGTPLIPAFRFPPMTGSEALRPLPSAPAAVTRTSAVGIVLRGPSDEVCEEGFFLPFFTVRGDSSCTYSAPLACPASLL